MKCNIKILRRINVLAAGSISAVYFLDKFYSSESLKNKLELKTNNAPAPVPPNISYLVKTVMKDMSLDKKEKSSIKIFVSSDFDMQQIGYPNKLFGAFLGVPQTFILNKTAEFDVIPMVNDTHLRSDSEEANKMKELLSLSTDAKKFAIAFELFKLRDSIFYFLGFLPLYIYSQAYAISIIAEDRFKRSKRTLPYFHAFVFFLAVWFYFLFYDVMCVHRDNKSVVNAANLGAAYIDGGIEYYEKLVQRNKLMKALNSNAPYTDEGEQMKFLGFRTISMPYERRIKVLNELKATPPATKPKNPMQML